MELIILVLCLVTGSFAQVEYPIVNTSLGLVQGALVQSRAPTVINYYAFKGIPFAEPPVGPLRFKPPQPPIPWGGIHNGTKVAQPCPQSLGTLFVGSEDCLRLDVYTAELVSLNTTLKPVMFWIYGGSFKSGGSFIYGPDFLITHDVVIVATNYRLGVLGFISTNDENAYGNMGFKDQVAALQWVQNNVAYFGGDPNQVTIFGESAGANSVHYLQLSPLGRGLFHKVMAHSGCALNPWAIQTDPLRYVFNLTNYFGIQANSTSEAILGLQQIDMIELVTAGDDDNATGHFNPFEIPPFYPVIEVDHPEAFVSKSGMEILESGDYSVVPFLFGHTSADGSVGLNGVDNVYSLADLDAHPEYLVSLSLNGPDDPVAVGSIIKEFFLGSANYSDSVEGTLRVFSNELFVRGMRKSIEFQRAAIDGYFYRFTYEASIDGGYPGVDHAHDVPSYWYIPNVNYDLLTADDWRTVARMTKFLTNFATYGSPTPFIDPALDNITWPAVTASTVGFIDINVDLSIGNNPNQTEFDFWNSLFANYGKPPFQTY